MQKNKDKTSNKIKPNANIDISYASEDVKNYSFSDYVRVRASHRGLLLSFGKEHPENTSFTIYKEILIPLDVALNLNEIISKQFKELNELGVIKLEDEQQKKRENSDE